MASESVCVFVWRYAGWPIGWLQGQLVGPMQMRAAGGSRRAQPVRMIGNHPIRRLISRPPGAVARTTSPSLPIGSPSGPDGPGRRRESAAKSAISLQRAADSICDRRILRNLIARAPRTMSMDLALPLRAAGGLPAQRRRRRPANSGALTMIDPRRTPAMLSNTCTAARQSRLAQPAGLANGPAARMD